MMSWGVRSSGVDRDTLRFVSKSGYCGCVCAALGMSARNPQVGNITLQSLITMPMGVRVLSPGVVYPEFQTAANWNSVDGKQKQKSLLLHKYYLHDADFLVGVESDDLDLLNILLEAFRDPVWPVFLGRKCCIPSLPLAVGVYTGTLIDVLSRNDLLKPYDDLVFGEDKKIPFNIKKYRSNIHLILETNEDNSQIIQDVPLSWDRRFGYRRIKKVVNNVKDSVDVLV